MDRYLDGIPAGSLQAVGLPESARSPGSADNLSRRCVGLGVTRWRDASVLIGASSVEAIRNLQFSKEELSRIEAILR
jgi:hypothetical protein